MRGVFAPARPDETGLRPPDEAALEAFAAAAADLARGEPLERALGDLVRAVARAVAAPVVLARLAAGDRLVARALHAESAALAAELVGSSVPADAVGGEEAEHTAAQGDPALPAGIRRAAARAGLPVVRVVPVIADDRVVATIETYGPAPFALRERALVRAAAALVAVAARLEQAARAGRAAGSELGRGSLELLGEALAAGADEMETAEQVVRIAAEAAGARGAALWRLEAEGPPVLLASQGLGGRPPGLRDAVEELRTLAAERNGEPRDVGTWRLHTVPLGDPPVAVLQLAFPTDGGREPDVERLTPFLARAGLALRRSRRVGLVALALRRSQTLVAVVSQAIARLSLAYTLETAVDRVAELTASGHVAVYLREGQRLTAAASRGLAGPHTELAERLLELALGPFRSRGFLFIEDMQKDPRLAGLEPVLSESDVRRALFVPLIAHDDVIGALGVFTSRARPYREGEEGLLVSLSSQLAVAVQNARLHERTKELSEILERTLDSERRAARQLRGLYEISHSFAESLSLQATLDAVARTMVELFDVDAAAIRMPDARGGALETRAMHVADRNIRPAAETMLARPQPLTAPLARRLMRSQRPVLLRPGGGTAGDADALLEPFLRQGSTAAVLPLATPGEVLGTLMLLSLDPTRPLERDTVEAAMTVTAQAALAIDNARLYQQQKDFSETMQRSLLPRVLPAVPGLEVGHVYESAARVDVGGDVYDFLSLDERRLAVVIGDVLGKGIEAAADMAMAKYSFRALARSRPDPSDFLASANEVVVEEIEPGKFITMLYVVVDPASGEVACASAGHPPMRVVTAEGAVTALDTPGLALGIEPGQDYPAERVRVEPGSSVVLFTDGVVESRRNGELYGEERLDRFLSERAHLGAQELADAILADCRAFGGGDLADDCAVVILKLAP
ncbi:MAG TPA: SpoIIE family protein phosphatase [Gaiellaceae bacterium]|nr:SpoIIE family protein phosphatase [Gaiellaceae bacterium]